MLRISLQLFISLCSHALARDSYSLFSFRDGYGSRLLPLSIQEELKFNIIINLKNIYNSISQSREKPIIHLE